MQTLLQKVNTVRVRQKEKPIRVDNLYKIRQRCESGALTSGASSKLAMHLERATGISRMIWLYPKENGNAFAVYFRMEKYFENSGVAQSG